MFNCATGTSTLNQALAERTIFDGLIYGDNVRFKIALWSGVQSGATVGQTMSGTATWQTFTGNGVEYLNGRWSAQRI